jgi:beta-glucosidase
LGTHPFPEDFVWGAATSAYQIEGSPLADGAGPSIWHRFAHTPGRTRGGATGDVACDHFNRWPDDVALMRELGLGAYRFSVAWGRVLPDGVGRINAAGLDFYDRLVDALGEAGIEPFLTLYHWDLPAALDDLGGWLNPDSPEWFGEYARAVHARLGDRVRMWTTLNEPWVVVDGGYMVGPLAPGHRNLFEAPRAAHHLMRAHAEGVRALRAGGARHVGLVVNLQPKHPVSRTPANLAAAARAHAYFNEQYLDPALLGRYPDALASVYGPGWPGYSDADASLTREPLDFLGVNYYSRSVVRADARAFPDGCRSVPQKQAGTTTLGWEVYPDGLTEVLTWVTERYGPIPLYVTENGAAFDDPATPIDGRVDDPPRVAYLRDHLLAVAEASRRGADVRGYFVWSLLDNFEWAQGYSKRFGIVHVDYATQRRTPKTSARFYAGVIRTNGRELEMA